MPKWVAIKDVHCARGKSIHVRKDIDVRGPNNFAVLLSHGGRIYAAAVELTEEAALERAEEQEFIPGPEGDCSWNAVWARITETEKDVEWEGSTAEIASRFFEQGTWNWLAHIVDSRNRRKTLSDTSGATEE